MLFLLTLLACDSCSKKEKEEDSAQPEESVVELSEETASEEPSE
tara:strand:- start:784 stop:915 length:132 start_codon:yes stop_codon:yes gene_type:complete